MKTAFERILMIVLILTLFAGAGVAYLYMSERIDTAKLTLELSKKEKELAESKGAATYKEGSDKITQEAQAEVPVKIEKVFVDKLVIDKTASKELAAINVKYAALEYNKVNQDAREEEETFVRIKSLWSTYCLAANDAPDCSPQPITKE